MEVPLNHDRRHGSLLRQYEKRVRTALYTSRLLSSSSNYPSFLIVLLSLLCVLAVGSRLFHACESDDTITVQRRSWPILTASQTRNKIPALEAFPLTSPPQRYPNAYATLCVGDATQAGVLVLFQSLRAVNARADLVVMYYNVSDRVIDKFNRFGLRTFPSAPLHVISAYGAPANEKMRRRDGILWSKLRAWQLEEYEKVVFMDADVMALRNVDELFEMPDYAGTAMQDRREKIMFYKDGAYGKKPRNKVEMVKSLTENDLVGSEMMPGWSGLNSGVTVLKPSNETFSALMSDLEILPNRPCCPSQEFLYHFFEGRNRFFRIPIVYNARLPFHYSKQEWRQLMRHIKVYHFIGSKPWEGTSIRQNPIKDIWISHKKDVDALLGDVT